jgi:hypothetical protein
MATYNEENDSMESSGWLEAIVLSDKQFIEMYYSRRFIIVFIRHHMVQQTNPLNFFPFYSVQTFFNIILVSVLIL